MRFFTKNYALIAILAFTPLTSGCFLLKMLGLGLTDGESSAMMLAGDDANDSTQYKVIATEKTKCGDNCEGILYFQ
jgi:hypothetical protein